MKEVQFESLLATPSRTIREVCEFIGEQFFEEMLEVEGNNSSHGDLRGTKGIQEKVLHREEELTFIENAAIVQIA